MVRNMDQQLESLDRRLIALGRCCCDIIERAALTLHDQDDTKIQKVFELDGKIDHQAMELQQYCMYLMLMRNPVAGDLRSVTAAMHMAQDMERIGDQAADLTQIVRFVDVQAFTGATDILRMAAKTTDMVRLAMDSYLYGDAAKAQSVIQTDDEVDALFTRVRQELIDLIARDAKQAASCMDFLMIAKYFERIGDHAQNIADWVLYVLQGELPARNDTREK